MIESPLVFNLEFDLTLQLLAHAPCWHQRLNGNIESCSA